MVTKRMLNSGMTLIETITSISLLAAAMIGPIALARQSLRSAQDARQEVVATHLAEEGIEIIRNMRDNKSADDTSVSHNDWMDTIFDECKGHGCIIDISEQNDSTHAWNYNQALHKCGSSSCSTRSLVYIHPQTGLYRQFNSTPSAPWIETSYRRVMTVEGIDNNGNPKRQVRITARVTYTGHSGIEHAIVISDDIYNWFPLINY